VGMMSGLVSRLLDRSRLEFGHLDIAPVATDAVAIVQQASDDASVLMEGRTIAVNAPAQLPVRWDEVRMGQVMGNLLANAARYGDGTVEVSMELVALAPEGDEARVRIAVRDHGPGVDPVVRARLFNPHRQHPGGSAIEPGPDGHGLGIGLYLSERIVTAHGGTIALADAQGGGTVVSLELPVSAPAGSAVGQDGARHPGDA
ncbi:MAG: sensor histidine kinase, partial [Thermomicrobiales bacterium]